MFFVRKYLERQKYLTIFLVAEERRTSLVSAVISDMTFFTSSSPALYLGVLRHSRPREVTPPLLKQKKDKLFLRSLKMHFVVCCVAAALFGLFWLTYLRRLTQ